MLQILVKHYYPEFSQVNKEIFCDSGHESPEKSAWGPAECY